jgi:hypothetical protein
MPLLGGVEVGDVAPCNAVMVWIQERQVTA